MIDVNEELKNKKEEMKKLQLGGDESLNLLLFWAMTLTLSIEWPTTKRTQLVHMLEADLEDVGLMTNIIMDF